MKIVTLLSDFGLQDFYVGAMKGVIAQIAPDVALIDLTHQIPPQNTAIARFVLMNTVPFFPPGTVHLAVVDPGVGSTRRNVAIAIGTDPTQPVGFLVGPDNGLFSGVILQCPVISVVELSDARFWLTPTPSPTFHGRDIFAAVAAHLARGIPLQDVGTAVPAASLVQLHLPIFAYSDSTIAGCIQAMDHFGNLITNIPATQVVGRSWRVRVQEQQFPGCQTYSDRPPSSLLALIGSHGWVEIAVNQGSAAAVLGLGLGSRVDVVIDKDL